MSSSSSSVQPEAWKSKVSAADLERISAERQLSERKGELVLDPKATYGIVCRACTKPNTLSTTFCTGCGFPCTKWDIQKLPENVFLQLVNGEDIGATVHHRDDKFIVFDDKFGVSDNHLDIIPTKVYEDISKLDSSHIPLLESLYELGKKELLKRNISWLNGDTIDDWIFAGYNFPVSVKHLHLHMVIPPFRHEKVLAYPRWHPHTKVLSDLKRTGKVCLYSDQPNEDAGKAEYQNAMRKSDEAKQRIAQHNKTTHGT